MIPLRDVIPSRTTPFVTVGIIVANALVFFYQLALGDRVEVGKHVGAAKTIDRLLGIADQDRGVARGIGVAVQRPEHAQAERERQRERRDEGGTQHGGVG